MFVVVDDELVTPPLSSGCLAGITRELLLEVLGDVAERDVPMTELARASEVFLTSTAREVQPVLSISGTPLAECPGPHTVRAPRRLARRVRARHATRPLTRRRRPAGAVRARGGGGPRRRP